MKKILIILLTLTITGCSKDTKSEELQTYENYIEHLKQIEKTSNLNYDINITLERITEEEIMYIFELSNIKEDMENIEAIVIHNKETENIFPTTGLFEEEISLKKGQTPKGIRLIGFIETKENIENINITFKALIKYQKDNKTITNYYIKEY